jgi:hypothetical protein
MKKVLLVLLVMLAFGTVNAQWKKNFYVDDFGDKTTDSYDSMTASGTFSNSATQDSKALYVFIKSDKTITIKVYEYESNLATSTSGTFEQVKIKTPSGVVVIDEAFFTKQGSLFFSKEQFVSLNEAISESGDYVMIFSRSGKYSTSSYKLKFSIK